MTKAYKFGAILFFGALCWAAGTVTGLFWDTGSAVMLIVPVAGSIVGGIALFAGVVNE